MYYVSPTFTPLNTDMYYVATTMYYGAPAMYYSSYIVLCSNYCVKQIDLSPFYPP